MQLTIDIGNTRAKASIFDKDKLVFQTAWTDNDEEEILNIIQKFKPTRCAFSNVGHEHLLITEASIALASQCFALVQILPRQYTILFQH